MNSFIKILNTCIVASTKTGIRITNQFTNISCEALLTNIKNVMIGDKDGSHFLRTSLTEIENNLCMPRKDTNMKSLANIVIIDCDKHIDKLGQENEGAPDPIKVHQTLKNMNIGHVLYGTHSHYSGKKGNRYRIILVTDKPYTKEQLPAISEAVISNLNINLEETLLAYATENNRFSQPWYYPRVPKNNQANLLYYEYLEGGPIETFEPQSLPSLKKYKNNLSPIGKEISPILAFNEQYSLCSLLTSYGYKRILITKEYEKWLSPESTSGTPGITMKSNKFYSHHNDSFNDGYWHDAFDLMRGREGLSERDAIIRAAKSTKASNGNTVDEYNKNLPKKGLISLKIEFKEYQPFDDELFPVESIPYDALPNPLSDYIQDQSDIRGCPNDYILVSLLARMGCVFAGKIKLSLTKNTDWTTTPNFFWAMIGEPSSGKSNALGATNKPLESIIAKVQEQYNKEIQTYKRKKERLESKIAATKKGLEQATKKKKEERDSITITNFEEELAEYSIELEELEKNKPKQKRYTLGKVTIEKLILILEENPEGVMIEMDELSSTLVKLSKDEHADERGLFLSGYNGSVQYAYDTVKRGTVFICRLLLSLFGGIQPTKLKRFLNEARLGYQDDGMLQRFQGIVFPDKKNHKLHDKKANTCLGSYVEQLFLNLDKINPEAKLSFEEQAQTVFDNWYNETKEKLQSLTHPYDAHLAKSYEFVASLAMYIYLAENNGNLTKELKITVKQISMAIKLGQYFFSHARRMYSLVYKDNLPARSLSEKIPKLLNEFPQDKHYDSNSNLHFFTRSQIRTKDWADLTSKDKRDEAIKILIDKGHISKAYDHRYYINPRHLEE